MHTAKASMTDQTEVPEAPVTEYDRKINAALAAVLGRPVASALDWLKEEDRRRRREGAKRRQRDEQRQAHQFVAGVAWAWGAATTDGTLALPVGLLQPGYVRDLLTMLCPALAGRISVAEEGAESPVHAARDPLTTGAVPTLATVAHGPQWADAAKDMGRLCVPPRPPKDPPQRNQKMDHAPLIAYILPEGKSEPEARRLVHRWAMRIDRTYGGDVAVLRQVDDSADGEEVQAVLGAWTQRDRELVEMFTLLYRGAKAWAEATYPDAETARAALAAEILRAIAEIPYAPDRRLEKLFVGRIAWTTLPRPVTSTGRPGRKRIAGDSDEGDA